MYGIKVIFGTVAIASVIAALMLIWFDTEFVFGVTAAKVYASMFVLLAIAATKECLTIEIEDYEQEIWTRAARGDSQWWGNPIW